MNRIALLAACTALAALCAADATANPASRPTGLDRAVTRMNSHGLENGQGTLHANPAARNPSAATPATPATPAIPATPGSQDGPATPATPAIPATPAMPNPHTQTMMPTHPPK